MKSITKFSKNTKSQVVRKLKEQKVKTNKENKWDAFFDKLKDVDTKDFMKECIKS